MTPLIALDRIAPGLWMKDEGRGPTGSWLDRYPTGTVTLEQLMRPPVLRPDALAAIREEIARELGEEIAVVAEPAGDATVAAAIDAGLEVLRVHGFLPSLRGAMALLARPRAGRVVVINPESGLRDLHVYGRRFPQMVQSEADKLGGLITPR